VINFFISYNKADRAWAEWVAWVLEEADYTTVLQAWDFRPSKNFVLEMNRAVRESERTIAILSYDYLEAFFTQPEWAAALAQDPTNEKGKLVPVRVRECEAEGLFKQIIYIDLVGKEEEEAKQTLLGDIQGGRAKPFTKPAFPGPITRSVSERPEFPGPHLTITDKQEKTERPKEGDGPCKDGGEDRSDSVNGRRRAYVFLSLVGLALGLLLGFILARRDSPEVTTGKNVFLIGSGTVHSYLNPFFKDPVGSDHLNVQLLQGPTFTGGELFAHIFGQVPVLVMAAGEMPHDKLSRPDKESERKPPAVFEVYLGTDPLQMLLVSGGKNARDETMRLDFPYIMGISSGNKGDELNAENLVENKVWFDGYNVYVGSERSGTRPHWEKLLSGAWPPVTRAWDIQEPGTANRDPDKPKIFLGSQILINIEMATNIKHTNKVLRMVNKEGIVSRGLYLYGAIDNTPDKKKYHGTEPGFDLDVRITEVLRYLLKTLRARDLIDDSCFKDQWNYLHLDSGVGWISEDYPRDHIYRNNSSCITQPKEQARP